MLWRLLRKPAVRLLLKWLAGDGREERFGGFVSEEMQKAQGQITAFWNTVAAGYDSDPANVAPPESRDYEAWTQAIRSVLPVVPSKVLDVGTGTGFLAWIAAELGHRVTGIDLAESMLEGARAQTAKRRLEVTFEVGDAVAPPFPDRSFDVVISRSLIWTLR